MGVFTSPPVVADSITAVTQPASGIPVVCASHGGVYSAVCALRLRASAAVFNDAGIGRDRAGIAGLTVLDGFGVAGVAVSHSTARIGDGWDCWTRGVVSVANEAAMACGVRPGMRVQEAHTLLPRGVAPNAQAALHVESESRHLIPLDVDGGVPVVALDSNSLVSAADAGAIVITGSHGGLLGGHAHTAVKYPVFAAFYNDAGVGIDSAGISRLPALQARGIAGIAVDAFSARIGDGLSTYQDGIVSFTNEMAHSFGIRPGMPVRDAVLHLAQSRNLHSQRK